MITATVYHVCEFCATAITNDDYSGIDQDTDYERITEFVESAGWLVDAGRVTRSLYWECESCEQVQDNPNAYALETIETIGTDY